MEELFKALKTGCALQKRQLMSLHALLNALALLLPHGASMGDNYGPMVIAPRPMKLKGMIRVSTPTLAPDSI